MSEFVAGVTTKLKLNGKSSTVLTSGAGDLPKLKTSCEGNECLPYVPPKIQEITTFFKYVTLTLKKFSF